MRMFYWMTIEGELQSKEGKEWSSIKEEIPLYSWICDPHIIGPDDVKCGRLTRPTVEDGESTWVGGHYSDFPPEFKTYLLLLGVTL